MKFKVEQGCPANSHVCKLVLKEISELWRLGVPLKLFPYAADKWVGGYGYGYLPKIWTPLAEDLWRQ